MKDKRTYYYKHQPLTAEQERENDALVELILQQQEEDKQSALTQGIENCTEKGKN